MKRLAILGLGTMGAGVASRLVAAGSDVSVWNRTSSVAKAFADSSGARAADDIASAVDGAEMVLSFLTDDVASAVVWGQALAVCPAGAIVVECSTISPERAAEFVDQATGLGFSAAVALMVGSKPQAENGMLTFLTGGEETATAEVASVLSPACGGVRHVGSPQAAAILKLAINTLLAAQLASLAELKQVTESLGMPELLTSVTDLPVFSPIAGALLARMRAGDFTPNFSVDLIEKDLGYMAQVAIDASVDPQVIQAVQAKFTRASHDGLGDKDFSVIGAS